MSVFLIKAPQPSDISAMVPLVTQAEQVFNKLLKFLNTKP